MWSRRSRFALPAAILGLAVLAFLLRYLGIASESFWHDEAYKWLLSQEATPGDVVAGMAVREDVHPPGYQLLLWGVMRIWGDGPLALRGVSLLAGVAAVPGVFLLGRRLLGPREGLLAAGWMAVLAYPIYYSRETGAYALLLLATLAMVWTCLAAASRWHAGEAAPWAVLAAMSGIGVVSCYLHYFGMAMTALSGTLLLVVALRQRRLRQWAAAHGAILLALTPWLATIRRHLGLHPAWLAAPPPDFFLSFLQFVANQSGLGMLLLAAAICLAALDARNRPAHRRAILLLLAWTGGVILLGHAVSWLFTPVLSYRNAIVTLPAALLLAARGAVSLGGRGLLAGWLCAALALGHLFWGLGFPDAPRRTQFREAMSLVLQHDEGAPPAPLVVFSWGTYPFDLALRHLRGPQGPDRVDLLAGREEDWPALEALLRQRHDQNGTDSFWYVYEYHARVPDAAFLARLLTTFPVLERRELFEATVLRLDARGRGP